jgi:hypothetical protein
LVRTPRYDETVNTIHRESVVTLNKDGSATLQLKGTFQALEQNIPARLSELHDDLRKKYLYQLLDLSDFEIISLSFDVKKDLIPETIQKLSLSIPSLASASGKRLFLPVSFLSGKTEIPSSNLPRQHPVQAHSRSKTDEDTIIITIPDGFTVENTLTPVSIKSVFGSFDLTVQYNNHEITVHRKLVMKNEVQPKEKFDELLSFLKNIAKSDQANLVLVH